MSHINIDIVFNISETVSVAIIRGHISTLTVKIETVSETLDIDFIFTQLIAREDFVAYSRRETYQVTLAAKCLSLCCG
jgi:hypothetical protein